MGTANTPPIVTIVTPSYNHSSFLEEAIASVLRQDYPQIEYIVVDAGSTDGTHAILAKYAHRLTFYTGPDRGTADAVNKGFLHSRGDIFAYLNADDTYAPDAVSTIVDVMTTEPSIGMIYGDALWVDESGRRIGSYPTKPYDAQLLSKECFICQPASFIRREVFERAGMMNPNLHFGFDYDLWIRIARLSSIRKIDAVLATSRMHLSNKTLGRRRDGLRETLLILKKHFGYVPFEPVLAYASHLVDKRDQFFEPLQPSPWNYLLSLPVGLRYNLGQPVRFLKEWAGVMSLAGWKRNLARL